MPAVLKEVGIDDRVYRICGRIAAADTGHRAHIYKALYIKENTALPTKQNTDKLAQPKRQIAATTIAIELTEEDNDAEIMKNDNIGPKNDSENDTDAEPQLVVIKRTRFPGPTERRELALHRLVHPHPNIVALLDFKLCSQYAILVLEHYDDDLFNFVQSRDNLLLEDEQGKHLARQFCTDILRAIEHCHANRIVHRDVKNENVFLRFHDKNTIHCVLGDFGLAIREHECEAGEVSGTRQCAAPEMLAEQPYDRRVDMWSAGISVYEMFIGRAPFGDEMDDYDEVLDKIQADQWTTDDEEQALLDANPQIWHFITSLLQKDPLKRPSASEALAHPYLKGGLQGDLRSP